MDKQTFLDQLNAIGTCEDASQRRDSIVALVDEATTLFDSNATLTEANQTLQNANADLKEKNMNLFLRVTNQKEEGSQKEEPEEKNLKYEDLFDENGGLK